MPLSLYLCVLFLPLSGAFSPSPPLTLLQSLSPLYSSHTHPLPLLISPSLTYALSPSYRLSQSFFSLIRSPVLSFTLPNSQSHSFIFATPRPPSAHTLALVAAPHPLSPILPSIVALSFSLSLHLPLLIALLQLLSSWYYCSYFLC